jgi:hypothetical protein
MMSIDGRNQIVAGLPVVGAIPSFMLSRHQIGIEHTDTAEGTV